MKVFSWAPLASLASASCLITSKVCANFPEFGRIQFRDVVGEEYLHAAQHEAACLKRAEDFHHWCGNNASTSVASTFMLDKTQFYDPSACDAGWSQWDTFCYRFHLDMKTWLDAENVCRASNAHLASIHSAEENSFVHHLANGLKVWIGYNGLKNELHSWSDHTQDDFTNFAKNCTDRAHEAECQPQQVQQWWYNSHAEERSPFVCKRSANVRTARVLKVSAERLLQEDWVQLRTMDPQLESSIGSSKAANASTNSSKECLPDEWSLSANLVKLLDLKVLPTRTRPHITSRRPGAAPATLF